MMIERKFIRGGGRVGHLEGVFVAGAYKNRGIATKLIEKLIEISRKLGCYKILLNPEENGSAFFERFGFVKHGIHMKIEFNKDS